MLHPDLFQPIVSQLTDQYTPLNCFKDRYSFLRQTISITMMSLKLFFQNMSLMITGRLRKVELRTQCIISEELTFSLCSESRKQILTSRWLSCKSQAAILDLTQMGFGLFCQCLQLALL